MAVFWDATLIMEAARTFETSVNFYPTTRRSIPEDSHLYPRCSFSFLSLSLSQSLAKVAVLFTDNKSVGWGFLATTVANDTTNFHNYEDRPCLLRTSENTTQGKASQGNVHSGSPSSDTPDSFNEEILFSLSLSVSLNDFISSATHKNITRVYTQCDPPLRNNAL